MDGRERERLRVAQHAAKSLRRASFRSCLEVMDEEGGRPIFAALPDDPASWVFEQVRQLGGDANVVVFEEVEPGVERLAVIVITDGPRVDEVDTVELHPDADFGLLVLLLKKVARPVHCQVLAPTTVAQLVTS